MDSIRQRIMVQVDTRFKTIKIGFGFKTDLGLHVNWWRDMEKNPFQPTELPGVNLIDDVENVEHDSTAKDFHTMPIKIEIASTLAEEMRKAIADIEAAMHIDRTWDHLASHTRLLSNESDVRHEGQKYLGTRVVMEVQYFTRIGDPFST